MRKVIVQDNEPHFQEEVAIDVALGEMDVVWMRKDPPSTWITYSVLICWIWYPPPHWS